jgi:WD40 repeat protein
VHSSTIWTLAMSPGGVRMVSGSADKSLAIWRCYTASEKKEMKIEDQNAEDGDGMHHADGLWKCVGTLTSAHDHAVYSVDCAPSRAGHGRIVSGGADNCINIYREVGGTSDAPLFTLDTNQPMAHDGDVNCVCWHPTNGRILISAGDDGVAKIWSYKL